MKSPYDQETGFIGGVALEKYRREAARRQESDVQPPEAQHLTSQQPSALPTSPNVSSRRPSTSFITPTDLRSGVSPTGRVPPPNARPPEPYPSAAALPVEHSRAKKGLPFLKNPMSTLLMRRRPARTSPTCSRRPSRFLPSRRTTPASAGRGSTTLAPRGPGGPRHKPPLTIRRRRWNLLPQSRRYRHKNSLRHHPGEAPESAGPPKPPPGRQTQQRHRVHTPERFTGTDTPSTKRDAPSSVSSKPSLHPSLDKPLPPRASPLLSHRKTMSRPSLDPPPRRRGLAPAADPDQARAPRSSRRARAASPASASSPGASPSPRYRST